MMPHHYLTTNHFYQTRSAWSVDQGSNKNHSPAYNFAPTVTKFCVMWEGLSLLHDTKFGNCRCKIVDSRAFPSWSLIHGLRWSGLIKAEPVMTDWLKLKNDRNYSINQCHMMKLHLKLPMILSQFCPWWNELNKQFLVNPCNYFTHIHQVIITVPEPVKWLLRICVKSIIIKMWPFLTRRYNEVWL